MHKISSRILALLLVLCLLVGNITPALAAEDDGTDVTVSELQSAPDATDPSTEPEADTTAPSDGTEPDTTPTVAPAENTEPSTVPTEAPAETSGADLPILAKHTPQCAAGEKHRAGTVASADTRLFPVVQSGSGGFYGISTATKTRRNPAVDTAGPWTEVAGAIIRKIHDNSFHRRDACPALTNNRENAKISNCFL